MSGHGSSNRSWVGHTDVHAYSVTTSEATQLETRNRDVETRRTLLRESLTSAPDDAAGRLLTYVLKVFNIKRRTYNDQENPLIVHVACEFRSAFANASDVASSTTGRPDTALAEGVFATSMDKLFNRFREGRDDVISDISQLLGESLRLSIPRSESGYY